ncbi:unnamed protein product [Brassicogethes aeneus]|uniref:Uncharacterized protein n=1 Tax=Brassicogethes aeneus TaxID=1431903 RepID=A0A9P0AWP4_BRAAE|nr:unnamed protein product [Brassicogethes aeneus]
MSSQEDINAESPIEAKDIFQPKQETPKIIRVLTVIAYALSVSMAAILLSIYYIFIWQGRPHIGAQTAIGFYENDNITSDYIIKPEELPPVFSIKNDFLESKNEIDLSLNDTEELTNSSGAEVRKLENRTHSPKVRLHRAGKSASVALKLVRKFFAFLKSMSYTSLNGFKNKLEQKPPVQTCPDTTVKLAGEEAKDKLYEPKHKKKVVRVLTVIAYIFFVSLAAIMLSMYYVFLWNGDSKFETKVVSVRIEQTPLLEQLVEAQNQLRLLQEKYDVLQMRCNEVFSDMRQQMTSNEVNPEEATTMLPSVTSTPEEAEENATWPVYYYDQKRKRSIFIKKIMNFKHSYNEFTK